MEIFRDERDHRMFLFLVEEMVAQFDVECWEYALMPTHFHLALLNRRENLSDALCFLKGEYASWWNRTYNHVGHVFQGRFKDQIVQHESYALSLIRYIARNPVRANLVARPEDWQWSSYRFTAGLAAPPEFLSTPRVLALFGDGDEETQRKRYVEHVLTPSPFDEQRISAFRSRQRIIGSRAFKQSFYTPRRERTQEVQNSPSIVLGFV